MDCSPVSLVFEHHCINQLMTSIHAPLPRTDDILTFIGAYLHPEDVRSFPPRSLSHALDRRELKFCLVFPPNGSFRDIYSGMTVQQTSDPCDSYFAYQKECIEFS